MDSWKSSIACIDKYNDTHEQIDLYDLKTKVAVTMGLIECEIPWGYSANMRL